MSQAPFVFAGFLFPRPVAMLPKGSFARRITDMRRRLIGPYTTAPKPITGGPHPGASFYFDSDFAPGLRAQYADELVNLEHQGWYCDAYQDETMRGIVYRLPQSRGFLAGWSLGEGMASSISGRIYDDVKTAAYAADSMAERAAEEERDYLEAEERTRLEAEEPA